MGAKTAKFQRYTDAAGQHRWRLFAANNRVIADSAEGYATERNVERAIDTVIAAVEAIANARRIKRIKREGASPVKYFRHRSLN